MVRYAPVSHSVIALGVAAALASFNVYSADAQQSESLEPIVVTATREPQTISRVLADVSVITRDEIEQQGPSTIVDLLKRLPGVEIVRNGGPSTSSSVFIRGAETRHVLVLIDGIPFDSQSTGGASWEALPASQIERIELVKGPVGAIYGSGVLAGVVQIFTRSGNDVAKLDVGLGGGSLGFASSDVRVSGGQGGMKFSLGVAMERSSGFNARTSAIPGKRAVDDDGYWSRSMSGRVTYRINDQHQFTASTQSQYINGEFDSSNASSTDDRSVHDFNASSAAWVAQWLDAWRSTVSLGQISDRYESRTSGSYVSTTVTSNALWANQLVLGSHTIRAVLDGRDDKLTNTGLVSSPSVGKGQRRDGALSLGYDWQQDAWSWQSSVREDHDSEFGRHVTGSASVGYAFNKAWVARASWGTGFRAPTLYQRYSEYGSAALKPERSMNREVGLSYRQAGATAGITAFHNDVSDLIQYASPGVCVSSFGCYRNVAQAELTGVELNAAVTLSGVHLAGAWNIDAPKNVQTDRLLARRARQHGSVRAETLVRDWTVGVQALLSGRRYDDAGNATSLGGYVVWGLDAQRQIASEWRAFVRVENLNDKAYQTALNYASVPRSVFVGVRWNPSL